MGFIKTLLENHRRKIKQKEDECNCMTEKCRSILLEESDLFENKIQEITPEQINSIYDQMMQTLSKITEEKTKKLF